jgi:cytochrome c oxidase subunit 1
MVFHNTQWVVALHAHTFLLTGVGMMLFAVVYALIPMLTNIELHSVKLSNVHFWTWIIGSVVMAYAMGMAGAQGMLRRTIYPMPNPYQMYLTVATLGAILMSIGFVTFLVNIVATLGWMNVLSLVMPEKWIEDKLQAAEA